MNCQQVSVRRCIIRPSISSGQISFTGSEAWIAMKTSLYNILIISQMRKFLRNVVNSYK